MIERVATLVILIAVATSTFAISERMDKIEARLARIEFLEAKSNAALVASLNELLRISAAQRDIAADLKGYRGGGRQQ